MKCQYKILVIKLNIEEPINIVCLCHLKQMLYFDIIGTITTSKKKSIFIT